MNSDVYMSYRECFQVQYHNAIALQCERCFEKFKILKDFINDISKSRTRYFCSRKSGEEEGWDRHIGVLSRRTLNGRVEKAKGG